MPIAQLHIHRTITFDSTPSNFKGVAGAARRAETLPVGSHTSSRVGCRSPNAEYRNLHFFARFSRRRVATNAREKQIDSPDLPSKKGQKAVPSHSERVALMCLTKKLQRRKEIESSQVVLQQAGRPLALRRNDAALICSRLNSSAVSRRLWP